MADSKEIVLAKREGFLLGSDWRYRFDQDGDDAVRPRKDYTSMVEVDAAKREFPLPKITRPRVKVVDSAWGPLSLRQKDGRIEFSYAATPRSWHDLHGAISGGNGAVADDFAIIAATAIDLLANPTETVEDDGE